MSTAHLPGAAAPLPSPQTRASDASGYFNPLSQQMSSQSLHPLFNQKLQQLSQQQQQQQQTSNPQQAFKTQDVPQRREGSLEPAQQCLMAQRHNSDSSSSSETSTHFYNATLLAEAASRAQLECTTRDIEEMQL